MGQDSRIVTVFQKWPNCAWPESGRRNWPAGLLSVNEATDSALAKQGYVVVPRDH
jgi:hypothetical protein